MSCCTTVERDQQKHFEMTYQLGQLPILLDIEKIAFGSDYGANSWTTRLQADWIRKILNLGLSDKLLDIGSGTGWPGLYLGEQSGCKVTMVDLTGSALKLASDRARAQCRDQKSWFSVANAADLPFRIGYFDAINHSDLLCCLSRKYDALVSCRRVIRQGGLMGFSVMSISSNLSKEDKVRAIENGPRFVESDLEYPDLLDKTGWKILDYKDLSEECAVLCSALETIDLEHKNALVQAIGDEAFRDRQDEWKSRRHAIEEGLILREFFLVTPT